jgi:hypothetical protein
LRRGQKRISKTRFYAYASAFHADSSVALSVHRGCYGATECRSASYHRGYLYRYREDHLNFAHNTIVPEKEAAERFERLLRYGGWQGKLLKVRTEAPRSIEGSTLPPMTDVIGRARNVVDRNSGGLPVEPFLRAFSDYELFEIYFLVQGDMPFQGLREWTTRDLQVKLIYTPGVYRYQVRILRHGADVDLRVPFHQPVQEEKPAQEKRKETGLGWRIAGWALVSVSLGALAYLVMHWAMRHSSCVPVSAQSHESTREG